MEGNEVTPAAMIRAEDNSMLAEQPECRENVPLFEVGTVSSHDDNFLVAKSRQAFNGIFQSLAEGDSFLGVNV